MTLDDVPAITWVREAGPDDLVFDSLLMTGPVVLVLLALLGRSLITTAIAVCYLGVFCVYTAYTWLT